MKTHTNTSWLFSILLDPWWRKNACLGAIRLKHISSSDAILWIRSDKKKLWLLTLLNKFWGTVWINQVTSSPKISPVCLHSLPYVRRMHLEISWWVNLFFKKVMARGRAHVENYTVLLQLFFPSKFPGTFLILKICSWGMASFFFLLLLASGKFVKQGCTSLTC